MSNDFHCGRKVVSTLRAELSKCSSFDFAVAFVTRSGITPLLQELRELESRGVPGRVLTTDYLAFSEPEALEKLDALRNVEVRMYQTVNNPDRFGFHAKVKKSDAEGADFYYFGRVRPMEWHETTQVDDNGKQLPIVNFKLELEHPAQDDLYEYFGGPTETASISFVA